MELKHGRIATFGDEIDLLASVVGSTAGDHVEIGCLWGGTAILVAEAKRKSGIRGKVYTIDPMTGGWWNGKDPATGTMPTYEKVIENIEAAGLEKRVIVVRGRSNPWPLEEVSPSTVFIDGDHSRDAVLADWHNARERAPKFVLFHDCDDKHAGVAQALREVDWNLYAEAGSLRVYERP